MTLVIHGARKLDAAGEVDSFWVQFDGDTIKATGHGEHPPADEVVDARGRWLVPGFIDLHTHGGGGFQVDAGLEAIAGALAVHRAHGTTRTVLSLVANPLDALVANLAAHRRPRPRRPARSSDRISRGRSSRPPAAAPTTRGTCSNRSRQRSSG